MERLSPKQYASIKKLLQGSNTYIRCFYNAFFPVNNGAKRRCVTGEVTSAGVPSLGDEALPLKSIISLINSALQSPRDGDAEFRYCYRNKG